MAPPTKSLDEKLWPKVDVRGPDECWPFRSAVKRGTYGNISHGRKTQLGSHVVAYMLTYGPVPEGLVVRHTCDYRPCCNPAHLLVGTHGDNAEDRNSRGRTRGGAPRRKECKRGHDDWYVGSDGRRRCRLCRNLRARERKKMDIPEEPFQ